MRLGMHKISAKADDVRTVNDKVLVVTKSRKDSLYHLTYQAEVSRKKRELREAAEKKGKAVETVAAPPPDVLVATPPVSEPESIPEAPPLIHRQVDMQSTNKKRYGCQFCDSGLPWKQCSCRYATMAQFKGMSTARTAFEWAGGVREVGRAPVEQPVEEFVTEVAEVSEAPQEAKLEPSNLRETTWLETPREEQSTSKPTRKATHGMQCEHSARKLSPLGECEVCDERRKIHNARNKVYYENNKIRWRTYYANEKKRRAAAKKNKRRAAAHT